MDVLCDWLKTQHDKLMENSVTSVSDSIIVAIGIGVCAAVVFAPDGRANRHDTGNIRTLRKDYFRIMYSSATDQAFCRSFRVSRRCFEDLKIYLETVWPKYYNKTAPRQANNRYSFAMKLAMALS